MNVDEFAKTLRAEPATPADLQMAIIWINRRLQDNVRTHGLRFPESWLPETGMAVMDAKNVLRLVSIVYFEKTSPVAVAGWVTTNPFNGCVMSAAAVRCLADKLPEYCRERGAKHLMTYFGHGWINAIFCGHGYKVGDDNVENLYREL